jgi:hypothetical protein
VLGRAGRRNGVDPGYRPELGQSQPVDVDKDDLDRHVVHDIAFVDSREVRHQARTFVELDQRHDARGLVGLGRMVRDDPAVDRAATGQLLHVPVD